MKREHEQMRQLLDEGGNLKSTLSNFNAVFGRQITTLAGAPKQRYS
jgi:hypothetical protein